MRLINADALMEMLRHDIDCYDTGKPDDKIYINAKDVKNMIDGQPTAYDLDKVVEQIGLLSENAENNDLNTYDEKAAYNTAYSKSIEIVKAGGVNG